MPRTNRPGYSENTLSAARRRLLEKIRVLQFGRIENLRVQEGEPVFSPATRVVKTEKLGTGRSANAHSDKALGTPELKAKMTDLLDLLDRVGTGIIDRIDVRDGLPDRVEVQEVAA
jgi:hypothetical protein